VEKGDAGIVRLSVRQVVERKQFRADLRRQKHRGKDIEEHLEAAELLAEFGDLPVGYRVHALTGEWSGFLECHIEPDCLLIYTVSRDEVVLIRTGSHADLFI
jgi:mRNA interferase YafQ